GGGGGGGRGAVGGHDDAHRPELPRGAAEQVAGARVHDDDHVGQRAEVDVVAGAARAGPPAQPPVGQDDGGQPQVERIVVRSQVPVALRLALEVDAVGVVLLRRHGRELRRAAGREAEVV